MTTAEPVLAPVRTGTTVKASGGARFRGDIEGLRGIAVLLVVLYHAGVRQLPAGFIGVDVFFVISGFLITGLLLSELRQTGSISLTGFYARRAKRLLPATAAVLAFVSLATWLLLPKIRWIEIAHDLVASALYSVNWRLAGQAVDYLAQNQAPSPVQHFWSLAVEEQFYLVWPLLLLTLALWARRPLQGDRALLRSHYQRSRPGPDTRLLLIGVGVIALPSLAWSAYLTSADPGRAYFVTTTRMWELAIGATVAILAPQIARLPRLLAAALGWAGLAAVLTTGLHLTTDTAFPGLVALVPTLGVAAVIAAGPAAGRLGPAGLLRLAPLQRVGALSYSLYLWHWPLIVIATAKLGELSLFAGLSVAALSVIPAHLSLKYIENPVRRLRTLKVAPRKALRLGVACTLVGVLAGAGLYLLAWPPPEPLTIQTAMAQTPNVGAPMPNSGAQVPEVAAPMPKVGAEVLAARPRGDRRGRPVDEVSSITPDPLQARQDFDSCASTAVVDSEISTCRGGDPGSTFQVVVVGDSHVKQWLAAIRMIAVERHWNLTMYLKSACPFVNAELEHGGKPYTTCMDWNRELRRLLDNNRMPQLLITSSATTDASIAGGTEATKAMAAAFRSTWQHYTDRGVKIVAIRDTPAPGIDMAECVSANPTRLTKCAMPRTEVADTKGKAHILAARHAERVTLADLTDAICPTDRCAAVIGGVMVYRDDDHLTSSYARSLAPRLDAVIARALDGHARGG